MTYSAKDTPRIAIFVESHEGLGHFNIINELTHQLKKQGAEVLLLSGTLDYAKAREHFNFDGATIVDLPLVDYVKDNRNRKKYVTPNGNNYDESKPYIEKRKTAIRQAIAKFGPDLVLSEFYPFTQPFRTYDIDAISESFSTSVKKPHIVCLCRDIIHNHSPEDVLNILNSKFDRVLVEGDMRFAQLQDSMPEWSNIKIPIEYTGNFISDMPARDTNISEENRPVVVFGGGGFHQEDVSFFESVIKSRKYSQALGKNIWDIYVSERANEYLVDDPNAPGNTLNAFEYIKTLAEEEGRGMIRVNHPVAKTAFLKELSNAAITVTRAGYNTTFELSSAGRPQLVIPRMDREQIYRSHMLVRDDMAQCFPDIFSMVAPSPNAPTEDEFRRIRSTSRELLNGDEQHIQSLGQAIDATAKMQARTPILNNNGAKEAATRLIELASKSKQPSIPLRS